MVFTPGVAMSRGAAWGLGELNCEACVTWMRDFVRWMTMCGALGSYVTKEALEAQRRIDGMACFEGDTLNESSSKQRDEDRLIETRF